MLCNLIERLRNSVPVDSFWPPYLDDCVVAQPSSVSVHLGVFVEPYLQFILDGTKKVESRFSVRPCAPYRRVAEGDIILLKEVGGPIVGLCQVGSVWYYELAPDSLSELRAEFAAALCVQDPEFWHDRASASFATLMRLERVQPIEPFKIEKRDRRGWVVIRRRSQQLLLWAE
jgi:hypothetical protein